MKNSDISIKYIFFAHLDMPNYLYKGLKGNCNTTRLITDHLRLREFFVVVRNFLGRPRVSRTA